MDIELEMSEELELALELRAAELGITLQAYLLQLLERDLTPDGEKNWSKFFTFIL